MWKSNITLLKKYDGKLLEKSQDVYFNQAYIDDFYKAIDLDSFKKPDFTVITHWHYDHTFGMHAINGISIAHEKTNQFLENEKIKAEDSNYINVLKKEDIHCQKEYDHLNELTITLSDISFTNSLTIDLGNVTANIFHTTSPHSEDTVCIYIPEKIVWTKEISIKRWLQ